MKFIKNNKGYSLLLAIVALVIFTVIGLSLLTVTANGFKKNESREDIVLATDLADKGGKYVVADLQTKLENMIKTPMGKVTFSNELDKMLGYNSTTQTLTTTNSELHCDQSSTANTKGIKIDAGTANNYTNVCILNVEMIKTGNVIKEEDRYKRIVTFKSVGVVEGKVQETITKVIFGTDSIPDQLKYAVSSNTGGVQLYGGVEIRGDIKSAQDITLHNEGYLRSSPNLTWKSSVYPRLLPAINTVSPKLILPTDGSIYQLNDKSIVNTEAKILSVNVRNNLSKYNKLNLISPSEQNYFQKLLFATPTANIVNRNLDGDNIDVKNIIQEVFNKKTYNTFSKGDVTIGSNTNLLNKDKNHQYLIASEGKDCTKTNWWGQCTEYKNNGKMGNANLTIDGKNLTLGGQYYINGNVTISNATLLSDAILYVDGDVNITYSELKGKTADSTLIIFATGKIYLGNISNNSNTPSIVKGFFYSKDVVNLFGVMSNMELHGGISGKSIVLAGIRGKYTSNGSIDTVQNQQGVDANGVPKLNPRLKIIYDENLIQSYTSFKRDEEEEFITSVNDPEIVERY